MLDPVAEFQEANFGVVLEVGIQLSFMFTPCKKSAVTFLQFEREIPVKQGDIRGDTGREERVNLRYQHGRNKTRLTRVE